MNTLDLISRQALCEYALNQKDKSVTPNDIMRFPSAQQEFEWCHDCKEYDQEKHCCPRWTKVIRNTVAELKQPQWIPCSERLPAKTGHYLCSFKKPNRIDNIFVDLAYWTGGRWYGYLANEINAWMPLPKPYEVEK